MAFLKFFKKRWFVACLLSFLLQKFAKVAIIVSRLFQKTANKPRQTFKTLALNLWILRCAQYDKQTSQYDKDFVIARICKAWACKFVAIQR